MDPLHSNVFTGKRCFGRVSRPQAIPLRWQAQVSSGVGHAPKARHAWGRPSCAAVGTHSLVPRSEGKIRHSEVGEEPLLLLYDRRFPLNSSRVASRLVDAVDTSLGADLLVAVCEDLPMGGCATRPTALCPEYRIHIIYDTIRIHVAFLSQTR